MATIGKLAVGLSARTQPFSRDMGKARRTVKDFGRDIVRVGSQVAAFSAALLTAAAAGIAAMVKQQLAAIDATTKLSDALGLTTEQLTGYQHAVSITGASNDELATAFRRMEKNISDATLGLTTAQRAFEALGLSADRLKNLSPDAQFKAIAEAFSGLSTQVDRARVAQDLFGRSGLKLVPLLLKGADGVEQLQREAEALGLTFSRVDGAKVEQANDAMTRAKAVLKGIAQTLTIQLAPFVEVFANRLVDSGLAGERAGHIITGALEAVAKGIGFAADVLHFFRIGWKGLQAIISAVIGVAMTQISLLARGLQEVLNLIPGKDFTFGDDIENLRQGFFKAAEDFHKEAIDLVNAPLPSEGISGFFKSVREDAQRTAEEIAKNVEEARALGGDFDVMPEEIEITTPERQDVAAQEIRSLAAVNLQANQTIDPIKKVEANTKEQLQEQRRGTGWLSSIDRGIRNLIDAQSQTVNILG